MPDISAERAIKEAPDRRDRKPMPLIARGIYMVLGLALALAALYCAAMLVVDGTRTLRTPYFQLGTPFGQSVQFTAAIRLLEGKPVYPIFADAGVYNAYGFMHTLVYAIAMKVFGATVFVPKAVAFAWSLFSLAGLGLAAYLVTGRRIAAVLAVGVFGGLYSLILPAELFGLRADAFCASASLWALCAGLMHVRGGFEKTRWPMIATLLFVCAGLAKQTFVLLPVFYFFYLWLNIGFRRTVLATAPAILLGVVALLWFNTRGEHFIATTMSMSGHGFADVETWWARWGDSFVLPHIIPLAIGTIVVIRGIGRREMRLVASVWAVAFVTGILPFIKIGGGANSLLFFEMLLGLLVAAAVVPAFVLPAQGRLWPCLATSAALVFLAMRIVPVTERSLREPVAYHFESAIDFISTHRDKHIYFPTHNYLTHFVQGEYYLEEFIVVDRCTATMGNQPLPEDLVAKIESGYFDYIIGPLTFDRSVFSNFLFEHYGEPDEPLLAEWDVYVPFPPDDVRRHSYAARHHRPILYNGSFEETRTGASRQWDARPSEILHENPQGDARPFSGKRLVALSSVPESWSMIDQRLNFMPTDRDRTLVFSGWAYEPQRDQMYLSLYRDNSVERISLARATWPDFPDGWARVELVTTLPNDVVSDRFLARVLLRPGLEGLFPIDAFEAGIELISERTFDIRDDAGRPNGWTVTPEKGFIVPPSGEGATNDMTGPFTLRGQSDSWGVLALNLPSLPEDRGRNLRVSAYASSPKADHLYLEIECTVNGETKNLVRRPWPVSRDTLAKLDVASQIPFESDPDSVRVRILAKDVAGETYRVHRVRAILH